MRQKVQRSVGLWAKQWKSVARAAKKKDMLISEWVREAILEKLEAGK